MSYLIFQNIDKKFAIKVSVVKHIIKSPPIYPLIGLMNTVKGLINHKGKIYTLYNLNKIFSEQKGTLTTQYIILLNDYYNFALPTSANVSLTDNPGNINEGVIANDFIINEFKNDESFIYLLNLDKIKDDISSNLRGSQL